MMASAQVDELLSGPLVTWFISCLEDPSILTSYDDLVDGQLLHNVFLQIDPEPIHDGVLPSGGNPVQRTKNLTIIVDNMKQFYEEELGHVILKLPDTKKLGTEPESHIGEMSLLLLLLLGCAVQCPNKEKFITKIKTLNVDTQLSIVDCIKKVTDCQDIVLTQDAMESVSMGGLFTEIKKIIQEKNLYKEKWKNVAALNESGDQVDLNESQENLDKSKVKRSKTRSEREDNHHFAVELADWKSRVRKQRQELEEKTEALLECKEELEHNKTLLAKIKLENQELILEARNAKSYRDELDVVIEKAERADRLELEVARYREKMTDIDFYKTRIEELREDNRVLMETREMLEEQLSASRRRADKVLELESEILKYKQLLNDVALERAADKEKYQELCDENTQLQRLTKAVASEAAMAGQISDSDEPVTTDNRLSDQLSNSAQARALKLELENRRLNTIIESLKENSFHESSSRVLELEKEKKKLTMKVESLNDNSERLTQQNLDLESICKQMLEENKKLQSSLKSQRANAEKQQQEIQTNHTKILELEKNCEAVIKEKQRIKLLLESVQKRADDQERSLEVANQQLEKLKCIESDANDVKTKCSELELKIAALEKDKETAVRDVHKYREIIEEKDVSLDKYTNTIECFERKVEELKQELENSNEQIKRLQEIERSSKELDSRAAMDRETLETLQSNLIAEKLNTQQLHAVLEQIGLDVDSLLNLPLDDILNRMIKLPSIETLIKKSSLSESANQGSTEVSTNSLGVNSDNSNLLEEVETLRKEQDNMIQKLEDLKTASENLQTDNAKLQVYITTLESQSASLTSQHAALQLANSQLVAEKDVLLKERASQQRVHSELLNDQVTLQSLHEQLTNEYENLLREKEALKTHLRDVKNESRLLRENCEVCESKIKALQNERDALINNANSLSNLRVEHSKLKEDFRNLFTTSEKIKLEYRHLQEDYKKTRDENNRLSVRQIEMQGEMQSKDEKLSNLELTNSKMSDKCKMLLEINSGLDNDRRSLMEHISLLFNQYHELLTHSLEDKEHHHLEEKMYTDKLNHVYRQKEKLEEKIMEHYRKLESCSRKKKSFGASIVRKMRKASSEFLKNRRSWAEDSKQFDSKIYESESGGNDSDASVDDHQLPSSSNIVDPMVLGHAGSRKTVYYNDDLASTHLGSEKRSSIDDTFPTSDEGPSINTNSNSRTEPSSDARSYLIYNKVSAVINETKGTGSVKDLGSDEVLVDSPPKEGKGGNSAVWYEYGCV